MLFLFYDYDIAGLKISDTFRKGLNDLEGAMGWRADKLIIERFGLNHNTITENNLMWIDNLKSGSGKDPKWNRTDVKHYMDTLAELERKTMGISDETWDDISRSQRREYGKRKCEANALVKDKETMELGQLICLEAIQKYY